MHERIPTVQKNEPITADAWNRLVGKLNEETTAPFERTGAAIKGEFWIKNATSAIMPAFSLAYITGFASTFSTVAAADSALASNRIVLNGALSGSSSASLAQLLDPIQPGAVGRATLTGGAGVFAVLSGSDSLTVGDRVKISSRTFALDSDGDFKIVAVDTTTRFALLQLAPVAGATYTAGGGISIDSDGEISNTASFVWAVKTDSGTTSKVRNLVGGAPHIKFSSDFQSIAETDAVGEYYVGLKTQTVYVAAMDADGNLTRTAVKVLQ